MSSTSILRASKNIVKKQVMSEVPRVWARQVTFGITALALKPIVSCNANARMTGIVRGTAESKMSRLLSNTKLPLAMAGIVASLGLVTEYSHVNVDHSDFNGLIALAFAVQTRIGRALPIFLETSYSGKLSSRDDAPKRTQKLRASYKALAGNETKRTIVSLKTLKSTLGFWPKLVFDRNFGGRDIIQFLNREKATFYVRMKAGRLVEITGKQLLLKDAKRADELVTIAGLKLRLVRSHKNGKNEEPWYILTNDFSCSRNKVVKIYYHRFEIEETFRDIKTNLGLWRTKLMKPNSLAILLWFVSLGILILFLAGARVLGVRELLKRLNRPVVKKRISWHRILMELREQEILQLSYGTLTETR